MGYIGNCVVNGLIAMVKIVILSTDSQEDVASNKISSNKARVL